MEKPLDRLLEDVMNVPGVTGVLCADNKGLSLAAKGSGQKQSAGMVASLAQQAARLSPSDNRQAPVVCIESDAGNILIKSHDNITMAVYKTPS